MLAQSGEVGIYRVSFAGLSCRKSLWCSFQCTIKLCSMDLAHLLIKAVAVNKAMKSIMGASSKMTTLLQVLGAVLELDL